MRIGENLPELLRGPFGGWVIGYIDMQNPARADLHRDQHVENLKRRSDRHEKIARNDRFRMIPDKRRPALGARAQSDAAFPNTFGPFSVIFGCRV